MERDGNREICVKLLELVNKRRQEEGLAALEECPAASRVAQECATTTLAARQRDPQLAGLDCTQVRYYEQGVLGAVEEEVLLEALDDSQDIDLLNTSDIADLLLDILVVNSGALDKCTSTRLNGVGVGFALSESHASIVTTYTAQHVTFEAAPAVSLRAASSKVECRVCTPGLRAVGVRVEFFSELDKSDIPGALWSAEEGVTPTSAATMLHEIPPWELNSVAEPSTASFELSMPCILQRAGIYREQRGVYLARVFVAPSDTVDDVPFAEPSEGFVFPDSGKGQFCGGQIALSYPPAAGSKALKEEVAHLLKMCERRTNLAVEEICLVERGETLPEGFEVYNDDEQLGVVLCVRKGPAKEGCVVELATAFGEDDVPAGFSIVGRHGSGESVDLRGTLQRLQSENDEVVLDEDALQEPIFLCFRQSSDPVEMTARGISEVVLQVCDSGADANMEAVDTLDIVPGVLAAVYRGVKAIAPEDLYATAPIDLRQAQLERQGSRTRGGGDDFDEDANLDGSLDDDEELNSQGNEWADLDEEKGFGNVAKLDPEALEGGKLGECILPTAESKRAELEEAERQAQASRIETLIENAKVERERLRAENSLLQKSLVPFMTKKKQLQHQLQRSESKNGGEDAGMATADGDDTTGGAALDDPASQEKERQYTNSLSACHDAAETLKRTREAYDKVAMELQTRLDEKEAKALEIRNSFAHFKREIAKAAENSRTGKPIPMRIIRQFEETEEQKDGEVEKVRLKNINLRSQLRKLEGALHEKEKLAEGLHLIDFEQLKIENQTLNEKIEERNEELHKLRKKTTTTVQVLTHIKEKLQFVQAEAVQLKGELGVLDKEVTASRDQLTKSKHARDALRSTNEAKKRDQGFVNSTLLVQDFQQRKAEIKGLKRTIRDLQHKYANLTGERAQNKAVTGDKASTADRQEER
ncbi:Coiled-coil domain-containing protein 96 [Durusdinium trenchii]|uniref:Coiled-coil domain-containing protein 96 n=1 Tax=Durusdinium trenchii TaxID=1381693 RepID=A0ABP0S5E9_9DINO